MHTQPQRLSIVGGGPWTCPCLCHALLAPIFLGLDTKIPSKNAIFEKHYQVEMYEKKKGAEIEKERYQGLNLAYIL